MVAESLGEAMSNSRLYEQDFYAWANQQAALLRAGRLSEADIEHIAEEIESMGRSGKRELINRLTVLLTHLLKWQARPLFRGTGWRLTLVEQRLRLNEHLSDNPSLRALLGEAIASAYRYGLLEAQRETGLSEDCFPATCPWSDEQILEKAFLPEDQGPSQPE